MTEVDELLDIGHCAACGEAIDDGAGRPIWIGARVGALCADCAGRPDQAALRAIRRACRHVRIAEALVDLGEELGQL